MGGQTKRAWMAGGLFLAMLALSSLACDLPDFGRAEPPAVTITAPASGSTVQQGQEIPVQSHTTDDEGVVRVELWADGVLVRVDASPVSSGQTPFVAIQPWRAEVPGSHVLIVKAYDADDEVGESPPVIVNVQEVVGPTAEVETPSAPTEPPPTSGPTELPPTEPPATELPPTGQPTEAPTGEPDNVPQIQITSPSSPRTVPPGTTVRVKVKATDDHGVVRIELWADGLLYRKDAVGGGKAVDWEMEWTPPAMGTYVLEAKALDTQFQPSPVARLEIHVEQPAQPTPAVPDPYGAIWKSLGGMSSGLGGPVGDPVGRFYAGQQFEHGFMFWRDNAGATQDWIFAFRWGPGDDQTQGLYWSRFDDVWTEGDPEYACAEAVPPYGPKRGFGKIWCERAEVRTNLGAAIEEEWGKDGGWLDFEHGVMLWDARNGRILVLYENGTWQAFPE